MKILSFAAAAATLVAVAVPGIASAQRWQPINARQASLEQRIDRGVRNRTLTRPEAVQLRRDLAQLNRLEDRYRAGGLSAWERQDLNRRFDALSVRVRYERNDRNHRRY